MTSAQLIPPAPVATLSVSVIVCTYTMERWDDVVRSIDSLRRQSLLPSEVILVVDHNDDLAHFARDTFPDVRVITNEEKRGLSGARNTGIRIARGDVIAFLDDDAAASPVWLETMISHYDDPSVQGVGGSATAIWTGGPRPRWLPAEFDWVVGCTYVGQPTRIAPVRNLVGCNMSFRRGVFDLVGGFSSAIGRIGKKPLGCEETELCIRLSQAAPDAKLLYDPAVNVEHRVSPDRREFRYFRSRCYSEGISKAAVSRLVGSGSGLSAERSYVSSVLPRAFLLALLQVLLLRPAAAGRAFSIVFGLFATTFGYARGTLAVARNGPAQVEAPPRSQQAPHQQLNAAPAEPGVYRSTGAPPPATPSPATPSPGAPPPGRPELPVPAEEEPTTPSWTVRSLLAAVGVGVLLLGLAVTCSRGSHYSLGVALFYTAVLVPFAVGAAILFRRGLPDRTRRVVVATVGVMPTLLYRLTDPLMVTGFDEQLHLRTLHDLLDGGQLYRPNPLLEASPHFPGLELLTVALEHGFHLPQMVAITVVVLLCRLVLVLSIYRLASLITGDTRTASVAVLCYAASPQFYFFNSQFAYQTLALSLAVTGFLLLARATGAFQAPRDPVAPGSAPVYRATSAEQPRWRTAVAAFVCFAGAAVTHHLTSWIAFGSLILWTMLCGKRERRLIAAVTGATLVVVVGQAIPIFALLKGYFGPILTAAAAQAEGLFGGSSDRTLFADNSGESTPAWERLVLMGYAVIITAVAVAVAVVILRHAWPRRHRLLILLGVLCLAYPATFAGRFAGNLSEISDRSTTFAFLPLAIGVAWVLRHRDTATAQNQAEKRTKLRFVTRVPFMITLLCLGLLGGLILGSGPDWQRLPGSYLVVADNRSLDAESLAAATWASENLKPGSSIWADRNPSTLLSQIADLWTEIGPRDGVEPATFYFSTSWGSEQTQAAKTLGLHYLYVDTRLAESKPHMGYYFYNGETTDDRQLTTAELTKFAKVKGITAVYTHGPVTIYDLTGLGVTPLTEGYTGSWHPNTLLDVLAGLILAALVIWRLAFVRRWAGTTVAELGGAGTAGTAMSAVVLVTGIATAAGFRPSWPFTATLGLPITVAVVIAALRDRTAAAPATTRQGSPLSLGTVAAAVLAAFLIAVGAGLALRSAWAVDVTKVNDILAAVRGT